MELNVYRLLLPEGTLDYFDVVDVKERVNEIVIYLEEKNLVPEQYSGEATESKGFYDPVVVQDFPLRGKKVYLNIRRRRWILKKSNDYICRNWRMLAEGTRMTQDFASFFKRIILIIIRSAASYWVLYMALTGICLNVNTATI